MRSPWWFVVAGVIAFASVAATCLYFFSHAPHVLAESMKRQRVVVPGSAVFELDSGAYIVNVERPGQVEASDGLKISIVSVQSGEVVPVISPALWDSRLIGERAASSFRTVTIARPGDYRVTVEGPADGRALVITQGFGRSMMQLSHSIMAIFFGGMLVAGIIVVITIWQREKARKTGGS
jgi:hypothetical protein